MTRGPRGLPGEWDDLVVLCANTAWEENPLAARNLAAYLADHAPVLYVDPPVSHVTALRHPVLRPSLRRPRLRIVGPRLARLTPVVLPAKDRVGMTTVTDVLLRRAIRSAVATLGGRVRALVAIAPNHDPFGACDEALDVFWVHDDYAAQPELTGIAPRLLVDGERRLAARADVIVAASPSLEETWRERGHDPVLIPNGCDDDLFARAGAGPTPPDVSLPPPIAVVAGRLSDRLDLALLEAVAQRDRSLLLVGPRDHRFDPPRLRALLERPTVRWIGERPFASLPSYLGVARVGLVPYADTAFNRGSFPLKTLEYLAAGLHVVACDLPAIRWLDTDLVTVARSADAFADAVERALDTPRDEADVAARRAFAARHSWRRRAEDWARLLGLAGRASGA